MTALIKLTDHDGYTRRGQLGETRWSAGYTRTVDGSGNLCGPGFVHAYEDLYIALLLNPIHAGIADPLAWRADGVIARRDHGLKVGCTSLTTIEIIARPEITTAQRVAFGVLSTRQVYADPAWRRWSNAWLDDSDRTAASAAYAAANAAEEAAWAAAEAAAWAAARAADAAAWAADAAWAAAAEEAAWAADAAARADAPLDLAAIARQVVGIR